MLNFFPLAMWDTWRHLREGIHRTGYADSHHEKISALVTEHLEHASKGLWAFQAGLLSDFFCIKQNYDRVYIVRT